MNKIYIVHLEWCENNDDGREIVCATTNYERARDEFEKQIRSAVKNHPDWTIMDNTLDKFYSHNSFPDHIELNILTYDDENDPYTATKEQLGRLITVGRKLWKNLTETEREHYYNDIGTIGFVEKVAEMLYLDLRTVTIKDFEAIHNAIIKFGGTKG